MHHAQGDIGKIYFAAFAEDPCAEKNRDLTTPSELDAFLFELPLSLEAFAGLQCVYMHLYMALSAQGLKTENRQGVTHCGLMAS